MKKSKLLLFCLLLVAITNSCLKDLKDVNPVNSPAKNTVQVSEVVTWLAHLPQAGDLHPQWNNATQIVLSNHNVIQLPIGKDVSLFFTKTNGQVNASVYKWLNNDPGAHVFTGNVIAFSFQDNSIKCLVYDKGKLIQSNVRNLYSIPLSSPGAGKGGSDPSNGSTDQQNFRPLDVSNWLASILCALTGGSWTGFQTNFCDYSNSIWIFLRSLFPNLVFDSGGPSGSSDPSTTTTTTSGNGSIASAIIASGGSVSASNATTSSDGSGGMVYLTVNPPPSCDPGIGGATFNPDGTVYDPCGAGGTYSQWVPISSSLQIQTQSIVAIVSSINDLENDYGVSFNLTDADKTAIANNIFNSNSTYFTQNFSDLSLYTSSTTNDDPPLIKWLKEHLRKYLGLDAPADAQEAQQIAAEVQTWGTVGQKVTAIHDALIVVFGFIPGMTALDNLMEGNYGAAAANLSFDVFGEGVFRYVAGGILNNGSKYIVKLTEMSTKYPNIVNYFKQLGVHEISIIKGSAANKVLIVGENMADRVTPADAMFNKLFNLGAEKFTPSAAASTDLANAVANNGGQLLNDAQFKQTLMFQENTNWVRDKIQQGYSVIDIGIDERKVARSVSYTMERSFIYK